MRPILFALLLAPSVSTAKKPAPGMTAEHIMRAKWVRSASTSPDGSAIAWLRGDPRHPGRDDNGTAWQTLHITVEGETRAFVEGAVSVWGVHWLPDSSGLTFLSNRSGDTVLYRIALDGGEAVPVLKHPEGIGSYDLSPDGTQVIWTAPEPADKSIEALRKKGYNPEIYEETHRSSRIWRAPLAPLPDAWSRPDEPVEPEMLSVDGHVSRASYSPDGEHLLAVVAPTSLTDDALMRQKLYILDSEDGEVETIIERDAKLGNSRWSPDSRRIAFVGGEDLSDPRDGRLYTADITTGAISELLPDLEGHVGSIRWRDEDTVVYVADMSTRSMVGEVDINREQRTLVKEGSAVWHGLSLSEDGSTLALVGDHRSHPSELFSLDLSAEPLRLPTRLTNINPWLDDVELAQQETISWQARDGQRIDGVILYPLKAPKKKGGPLIMMVHGGPESHVSDGWVTGFSRPAQLAAAQGYTVLLPNYRGSTGRGVAFSKLDQHDQAGAEFDDLVDAIAPLAEKGLVDPERVGITGSSYGGYASAWAATKLTQHFAAAVMSVGISDMVSKFGTTDIPTEAFHSHSRVWPWEEWEYFRERSPITWVEGARTPILIMHGKNDARVHPSQSLELYRYLKLAGSAPARLVYYPGEGHGNRRSASRYDYMLRLMRWFDHYLVDKGGDPPPWPVDYGLDVTPPAKPGK